MHEIVDRDPSIRESLDRSYRSEGYAPEREREIHRPPDAILVSGSSGLREDTFPRVFRGRPFFQHRYLDRGIDRLEIIPDSAKYRARLLSVEDLEYFIKWLFKDGANSFATLKRCEVWKKNNEISLRIEHSLDLVYPDNSEEQKQYKNNTQEDLKDK